MRGVDVSFPVADHDAYSRIHRFATCPVSFRLHYHDPRAGADQQSARFGTMLHRVVASLLREHVRHNRVGRIAVNDAPSVRARTEREG